MKFESKYKTFRSRKCIWKYRLRNGGHFVQREMSQPKISAKIIELTLFSVGWKKNIPIPLTHWGRVTHICVSKQTIIGSYNGLSPGRRQAIIWTNAGILLIGPLGTNFSEFLIQIQTFSFKKIHLKMSSAKWGPFCLGLNVLNILSSMECICSIWATWHMCCYNLALPIETSKYTGLQCKWWYGYWMYSVIYMQSCRPGTMKIQTHLKHRRQREREILVPNRQQAITWANDYKFHIHIYLECICSIWATWHMCCYNLALSIEASKSIQAYNVSGDMATEYIVIFMQSCRPCTMRIQTRPKQRKRGFWTHPLKPTWSTKTWIQRQTHSRCSNLLVDVV